METPSTTMAMEDADLSTDAPTDVRKVKVAVLADKKRRNASHG
jgi:hypothetical protein